MTDYNSKAHLELIDKQAKLLEKMMQPTIMITQKTLRDEFAMAALPSVMSRFPIWDPKTHAIDAYAVADAMMEARK